MKRMAVVLVAMSLGACAAPQVDGPAIHIGLSPAAQPAQAAVSTCVPSIEGLSVSITSVYPNVVTLEDYDFYIQLGVPNEASTFIAQLATDEITAVTNASNNADLSPEDLVDIFAGRVRNWEELGGAAGVINLWVGLDGDEARQAFEAEALLGAPIAGWAKLAADPQQILAEIAADPFAAGILPGAWVDPNVNAMSTGVMLPLLAIAEEEPSGAARQILACLQSEVGQAALSANYTPLSP